MAAISALNPKAEVARSGQALLININAAAGLQDVLKTNLGPRGTIKMCDFFSFPLFLPAMSAHFCFLCVQARERLWRH